MGRAVAHPSPEWLHRADQTRPGQPQGERTSPKLRAREVSTHTGGQPQGEPTSRKLQGREGEHAHGWPGAMSKAVFKQAHVCVTCGHVQRLCSHTWRCVCRSVCASARVSRATYSYALAWRQPCVVSVSLTTGMLTLMGPARDRFSE